MDEFYKKCLCLDKSMVSLKKFIEDEIKISEKLIFEDEHIKSLNKKNNMRKEMFAILLNLMIIIEMRKV